MPANGSGFWERLVGTFIPTGGALLSAQVNEEVDNLNNGVNYALVRSNQQGTQTASTISDFTDAVIAADGSYATRAELASATVPAQYQLIEVRGHTIEGVGGAFYRRMLVAPSVIKSWHIQSADGAWWVINEPNPRGGQFGMLGDGITNNYAALVAGLEYAAGSALRLDVPAVAYMIGTATITVPADTAIIGQSKTTTKLQHAFNGDMFILSDGAKLESVYLEGDGANFTGGCMVFNGTAGRQIRRDVKAINFVGPIESFAVSAGSQSYSDNCTYRRTNGVVGSGLHAVVMSPTQQLLAVPKTFVGFNSDGFAAFDFGGSNDAFIFGGYFCDLKYTLDTRGVLITAARIGNVPTLLMDGHNNTITGCDIAPQITIALGADNIAIVGNSHNLLPVIDNSGNARNQISTWDEPYAGAITSGGAPFALGNGTLTTRRSRNGATTTIYGELTFGSTTTPGTGGYSISLPQMRHSANAFVGGSLIGNRGGTLYAGVLQIAGNVTTASFLRDTTGSITFNSPAVWSAGDTIRWSITYSN